MVSIHLFSSISTRDVVTRMRYLKLPSSLWCPKGRCCETLDHLPWVLCDIMLFPHIRCLDEKAYANRSCFADNSISASHLSLSSHHCTPYAQFFEETSYKFISLPYIVPVQVSFHGSIWMSYSSNCRRLRVSTIYPWSGWEVQSISEAVVLLVLVGAMI